MSRSTLLIALSGCFLTSLSACGPKGPTVQSAGTLPRDAGYAFADDAAPPSGIAPALTEALGQDGLQPSDHPRYLVQAGYSRPPARSGTLVADQKAPEWQRAPVRQRGSISRFSLSVTEVATGAEIYRTAAWQRSRAGIDDGAALVQAAFNPPAKMPSTPPPPPPPPAQ